MHFVWDKIIGKIRQTVSQCFTLGGQSFKLTMLASNMTRMVRMLTVVPQGAVQ
ncbi:hypothetical protein BLA15816_04288 [Burkholderia lata]|nr:hypothetical protein BLA15816_04288 [Burkholderia lata]